MPVLQKHAYDLAVSHLEAAGLQQDTETQTLEVPEIGVDSCANYSADIHSFH